MQVSISNGISIHMNMNMIIGICRNFTGNINIRIIHSRIRLKISVNAGINTIMILNIQQIINVSVSLGDSMTVNIIRVLIFVAASILMRILLLVFVVIRVSNSASAGTNFNLMICIWKECLFYSNPSITPDYMKILTDDYMNELMYYS